jgi:hypothetical protein
VPAELADALNALLAAVDGAHTGGAFDAADALLAAGLQALAAGKPAAATAATERATAGGVVPASGDAAALLGLPVLPLRARLEAALQWRVGRNCHMRGSLQAKGALAGDSRATYEKASAALERSLALHEADADAHKYAGIVLSRVAKDTKEKIANAYKIRDHTQRAIALRASDPVLHHMLGVWCYEVSSLGWLARKAATALFGAPPESTYAEAVAHLTRAEALATAPGGQGAWMTNRLKLAQAFFADGDRESAKKWVAASGQLKPGPAEDADATTQQRDLAGKLGVTLPA